MEEHELIDASERRKWGASSGDLFPRLFAEEDDGDDDTASDQMGSEGCGGTDPNDDDTEVAPAMRMVQGPQLHSRVRRGSEGYEVRPMMYDAAYAADLREEEERLRDYLMAESERLGQVWNPDGESGAVHPLAQVLLREQYLNSGWPNGVSVDPNSEPHWSVSDRDRVEGDYGDDSDDTDD